jgi:ferredoxin
MTTPVVVAHDTELCALSGYCARIAPLDFTMIAGELILVADGPVSDQVRIAKLREAENVCPTGAITIEET